MVVGMMGALDKDYPLYGYCAHIRDRGWSHGDADQIRGRSRFPLTQTVAVSSAQRASDV
jgi:hypothetical protein